MKFQTIIIKMILKYKRKKQVKKNLGGERFLVPREGAAAVDTILYRPKKQAGELRGVRLSAQVLCYPFLDFTMGLTTEDEILSKQKSMGMFREIFFPGIDERTGIMSPALSSDELLKGSPSTLLIVSKKDDLYEQSLVYERRLKDNQVPVKLSFYQDAVHGFLESNHPEYPVDLAKSVDQADLAAECEKEIADWMKDIWNKKN